MPRYPGPGSVGHGYTEECLEEDRLYYSFRLNDELVGISLDTTRRGGHYVGEVSLAQLRWLERELGRHRDTPVLVFSHPTSANTPGRRMTLAGEPGEPGDRNTELLLPAR